MTKPRKRLFFALWPDQEIRRQIAGHARQLENAPGKKIPPRNYHITLLFLGAVDSSLIPPLLERAAQIACPGFRLQINKSGFWKKSQILWLGPEHCPQALSTLVDELQALAKSLEIPVEKRPYQPHISLQRKLSERYPLELETFIWDARDFCLVESVTQAQGARYDILASWPLKNNPTR